MLQSIALGKGDKVLMAARCDRGTSRKQDSALQS